jgi:hypothetical protein
MKPSILILISLTVLTIVGIVLFLALKKSPASSTPSDAASVGRSAINKLPPSLATKSKTLSENTIKKLGEKLQEEDKDENGKVLTMEEKIRVLHPFMCTIYNLADNADESLNCLLDLNESQLSQVENLQKCKLKVNNMDEFSTIMQKCVMALGGSNKAGGALPPAPGVAKPTTFGPEKTAGPSGHVEPIYCSELQIGSDKTNMNLIDCPLCCGQNKAPIPLKACNYTCNEHNSNVEKCTNCGMDYSVDSPLGMCKNCCSHCYGTDQVHKCNQNCKMDVSACQAYCKTLKEKDIERCMNKCN